MHSNNAGGYTKKVMHLYTQIICLSSAEINYGMWQQMSAQSPNLNKSYSYIPINIDMIS